MVHEQKKELVEMAKAGENKANQLVSILLQDANEAASHNRAMEFGRLLQIASKDNASGEFITAFGNQVSGYNRSNNLRNFSLGN